MIISVIVPVFNAEHFVSKCIDSILKQTFKHLEVILVDDGSTDGSTAIMEEYKKKDCRIIVMHQRNLGQAEARNCGLRIASGEYISFVDSDDYIEPEMYSTMLAAAAKNDAGIVVCGRNNVSEAGDLISKQFVYQNEFQLDTEGAIRRFLMFDGIDGSPCDKLFRKDTIVDLFFPSGYICEDLLFTYYALKRADRVLHIGAAEYNYVQRSGSTSHSKYGNKTKGLMLYPRAIMDDVSISFPKLNDEASAYYYIAVINYIKRKYVAGLPINGEDNGGIEPHKLLLSRYVPLRLKLLYLALYTNTYRFLGNK